MPSSRLVVFYIFISSWGWSLRSHIQVHELDFFAKFVFVCTNHRPYGYVPSHEHEGQLRDIRLWAQNSHINKLHSWGKIGAHPRMKFILGYVYMCCKDGGDTHTQTKCDLSNILLSLDRLYEKYFSLSVFNSCRSSISKFELPKMC